MLDLLFLTHKNYKNIYITYKSVTNKTYFNQFFLYYFLPVKPAFALDLFLCELFTFLPYLFPTNFFAFILDLTSDLIFIGTLVVFCFFTTALLITIGFLKVYVRVIFVGFNPVTFARLFFIDFFLICFEFLLFYTYFYLLSFYFFIDLLLETMCLFAFLSFSDSFLVDDLDFSLEIIGFN